MRHDNAPAGAQTAPGTARRPNGRGSCRRGETARTARLRREGTRVRAASVRRLLVLCCLGTVVLSALACAGGEEGATPAGPAVQGEAPPSVPAGETAAPSPAGATTQEVVTGFLEAYGAFDTDEAITYLAEDADVSGLVGSVGPAGATGTLEEFPLLIALLEAEGYKQMLDPCEELGSSASGTDVRCTFDFHLLGSDEIGLGPYGGSYFELTVRDGEIVRASVTVEITEFSPQMWEPFLHWVRTAYPEDTEIMYAVLGTGARLTEESIRLWEQHRRDYVAEVARSATGTDTSS